MTSGYDRRQRFTKRLKFRFERPSTSTVERSGSVARVSEDVTSFRSDVQERNRVPASSVDLYNGFRQEPGGLPSFLNPGARLLAQLEASGLAEPSDYKAMSPGKVLDNGHPFQNTRHEFQTSARQWVNYLPFNFSESPSNRRAGFPASVGVMNLSAAGQAKVSSFTPGNGSSSNQYVFSKGLSLPSGSDLAGLGKIAISQCAPAVPEISTTVILGELLQSVPLFPGHTLLQSLKLSGVGDEYLNLVFGLIPTLSDAKDLAKILDTYTQRLHQLRRDAGRPVRRTFRFPQSVKAEILTTAGGDFANGTRCYVGNGIGFDARYDSGSPSFGSDQEMNGQYAEQALFCREVKETWFKGSFTYVLPKHPGLYGNLERYYVEMDRLMGLQLDSSAAWALSPWSWLIDWFVDVSAQMDIISVNYDKNLVLNYGYAMQQTERSVVGKVVFQDTSKSGVKWINTSMRSVSKKRIRANPYGFVLPTDGNFWDGYRLAVLGALGLSRL